jgi:hypothetical protein
MFTAKDFDILNQECPALRLSDMLVDKEVTEDNVEKLKEALGDLKLHEDRLRALRQKIIKKLRDYDFQRLKFQREAPGTPQPPPGTHAGVQRSARGYG